MINGDTPISRPVAIFLTRLEKYVVPLLYAFLAWRQFQTLSAHMSDYSALSAKHSLTAILHSIFAVVSIRHILLLILLVFCGSMLAFSRAPSALPNKLKHVLLPLAMSFYIVLYTMVDPLPMALRRNLLPTAYQLPFGMAGVIMSIFGYGLIFWAISYLRRAFGLFVTVRGVVLGGPYAYVRHPIYTGYLLDSLALLAATCSVAMFVLVAGFITLMVCRARLEEEILSEASGEYAQYRLKSGFLFPRLR